MGGWEIEKHQPEPWSVDGSHILSASGWNLAKAVLIADARRIVAAINDTQGIPTAALEAGFLRDFLELTVRPRALWERLERFQSANAAEVFLHEPLDPADPFSALDRRLGDRRRGERRRGYPGHTGR